MVTIDIVVKTDWEKSFSSVTTVVVVGYWGTGFDFERVRKI
jgi:hypothetical protein